MSDAPGDEAPRPRRRKHRRATRPATGGDPNSEISPSPGKDDTDEGWAPDAPDRTDRPRVAKRPTKDHESAEDRWWREQRPPHWE